jgi:hypothetical protein
MKFTIISLMIFLIACKSEHSDNLNQAQLIIDEAIKVHGGEKFEKLQASFDFRKYHFDIFRKGGVFQYTRSFQDSTGAYIDIKNNEGVARTVDGKVVQMDEKTESNVNESINSQVYFALLPFGLNDAAVNKKLLGESVIGGKPYYEIEVTFQEEGGGKDFEDVFVYWIHKEKKTMDYLAYKFHVNGGGIRFRKAYNIRNEGGIMWADYINYKEIEGDATLDQYDQLWEEGKLKELSRIELKNVKVQP